MHSAYIWGHQLLHVFFPVETKPKIQRRHSLHSPTGEPRHPVKHISSVDSSLTFHPQSMLLDLDCTRLSGEKTSAIEDLTLQIPNGTIDRVRSKSNQDLDHCSYGFSLNAVAAQPHTCNGLLAPTTSLTAAAPSNSAISLSSTSCSGRPTLIKQFSQAIPCAADSPSPVEKDGVLPSSSSRSKTSSHKPQRTSVQVKYTAAAELDTARQSRTSPKKLSSSQRTVSEDKQYLDACLHSSIPSRNKAAPNHSHSNPEFPLVTVNQTERTHSYDDLYKRRKCPPFCAQAEENQVSPSREKINSLSSQIYSSLNQNWATTLSSYTAGSYQHILKDTCTNSESNPACELMQKVISGTTQLLNLNQAHVQTLMEVSSACSQTISQQESVSMGSYPSLCLPSDCTEGEDPYDSPVSHLLSLGYKLVEKPLRVKFGVPSEGYMTLTFKLIGQSVQKKDVLLKVCTRTYVTLCMCGCQA